MPGILQSQKRQKISDDPSDLAKPNADSDDEKEMENWPLVIPTVLTGDDYLRYLREVQMSKGFEVSSFPGRYLCGGIVPLPRDAFYDKVVTTLSKEALDVYNKSQDAKFEFVEIVKSTFQSVAGMMYYITFKAKQDNDPCQTFRAKVWNKVCNKGIEVKFCEKV